MTAIGALIMIIAFVAFLVLDRYKSEEIEVITTEFKKDSIKLHKIIRDSIKISKPVIEPIAYAVPTKRTIRPSVSGTSGELPLFTFYLHLKTIDSIKNTIANVDYFFNHPTFRQKHNISKDPSNDFKISYTGWGCLDTVTIAITKKDKSTDTMYFRMCNNLKLKALAIDNPNN